MPNFKVDVDYGLDYLNFTITNSSARKITPAWKTKSAPKLGPRKQPSTAESTFRPADRPKINAARSANAPSAKKAINSTKEVPDATETTQQAAPASIAPNGAAKTATAASQKTPSKPAEATSKGAPKAANTSKPVKAAT